MKTKKYYWECWYCRSRGRRLHKKERDAARTGLRHEIAKHGLDMGDDLTPLYWCLPYFVIKSTIRDAIPPPSWR